MTFTILQIIIISIFGLLVGSFLNVVIARMGTGRSVVSGRSQCMSCGHTLAWYDLIPVLSFLMTFGRCRYCMSPISSIYIIVEFLSAGIWLISLLVFGLSIEFVFAVVMGTILLTLSVYDIRHKIIPNIFSYLLVILAVIFVILSAIEIPNTLQALIYFKNHILSAIILPFPFYLLWRISHGKWFGLGDVKLMIAMGMMLGLGSGVEAIISAFWIATALIILIVILQLLKFIFGYIKLVGKTKRPIIHISREIPFGPFLSIAFFLEILQIHVFQWIIKLFV